MKRLRSLTIEGVLLILSSALLVAGTIFAVAAFHWSLLSVSVALLVWGAGLLLVVWKEG